MEKRSKGEKLRQAFQDAAAGKRTEPRAVLRETVAEDPTNYRAWLWLAYTAETIEEKRMALYEALLLNPAQDKVREEFKKTLQPSYVQAAAEHGAFMCYSRADELFAVELAERIKARSLPVWIDMLDVPVDINVDWNKAIEEALAYCGVMLAVLSPDFVSSDDQRAELDSFLQEGKVVLPLLYRECDWQSLNLVHPVIDFRHDYKSGLRMVFALLGILNAPTG